MASIYVVRSVTFENQTFLKPETKMPGIKMFLVLNDRHSDCDQINYVVCPTFIVLLFNFRLMNMSPYGNVEINQLVTMLVEARNIDEQVNK